jgi:hypothetical protein
MVRIFLPCGFEHSLADVYLGGKASTQFAEGPHSFYFSIDAAIRVNLSSSETFADLVITLGKTLQSANKHGHLPFGPVAEEVGHDYWPVTADFCPRSACMFPFSSAM